MESYFQDRACSVSSIKSIGASALASVLLKPFTSDWDLKPTWLGSKLAKTHSTWFQNLMKVRSLMSHHRKNSVRGKVIGKKWLYSDSESSTLQSGPSQTASVLPSRFSRVRLCDPIDSSPLGSSVPGILQARTLERVPISFSNA